MKIPVVVITSLLLIVTLSCDIWDTTANGALEGVITDFVSDVGIEGVTVELVGEDMSDTTDSNGAYKIEGIPEGHFTVLATGASYVVSVKSGVEIYANETTILNFRMTYSDAVGRISGQVTNAINGLPVSDALVNIIGENLVEITDTSGVYIIENIPAGFYSINASSDGYYQGASFNVEIGADSLTTAHFAMSPEFSEDNQDAMRIVLTWGEHPNDIDLHLKTPEINGQFFHIFSNLKGDSTNAPFVWLDRDDIDSYGPETVTIYEGHPGSYHYYVHKYAGEGPLIASGAKVSIFTSDGLLQSFDVPVIGEGIYWNVCLIDAETGAVTPINLMQDAEPGRPDPSPGKAEFMTNPITK